MQTKTDNDRKTEAARNLELRRQQLKEEKKFQKNKRVSTRKSAGRTARRRRARLERLILLGIILIIVLLGVIACTAHSRKAGSDGASAGTADSAEADADNTAEDGTIVIGLKGSSVQMVLEGDPYIENGAFAVDSRSGAINADDISISGDVDTSVPGDYTVKYSVKNNGLRAETQRTVRVLNEEEFGNKASNVPVMMYHWVYTESDVPDDLDGNWILDTTLDEQLGYLNENNYYFPGWKELSAWIDGEISLPAKITVLTFDDGKEAFLKYGILLLEKHQIPATSFMICWEKNSAESKIKEYASPYIDFESHTYAMHQKTEDVPGHKGIMAAMSKDEIIADLAQAAEMTGNNDAMAYPYGDYTDEMTEAVREEGILCAFTVEYDRVRQGMDRTRLPRIRVLGDESFEIWRDSVY